MKKYTIIENNIHNYSLAFNLFIMHYYYIIIFSNNTELIIQSRLEVTKDSPLWLDNSTW